MDFVILDESTASAQAAGGPLTVPILEEMADALDIFLNRDVAPAWGGAYRVRLASGPGDIVAGEVVARIVDVAPDPGTVAWHAADGSAHPVVYVARSQCQTLITGPESVSGALGHEFAETVGDPFVNVWADDGDGVQWALELVDAVESDTYEVGAVTVPNFLLRSFFGPGAPGPWSYLGTLGKETAPGPFASAPGGYQVKRVGTTVQTQVNGKIRASRLARLRHWSSRAYKRGARF